MTKRTKTDTESLEKAFSRIVKIPSKEFGKIEICKPKKSIDPLKVGITKTRGIAMLFVTLMIIMIGVVSIIIWVGKIYIEREDVINFPPVTTRSVPLPKKRQTVQQAHICVHPSVTSYL